MIWGNKEFSNCILLCIFVKPIIKMCNCVFMDHIQNSSLNQDHSSNSDKVIKLIHPFIEFDWHYGIHFQLVVSPHFFGSPLRGDKPPHFTSVPPGSPSFSHYNETCHPVEKTHFNCCFHDLILSVTTQRL